MKLENKVCAICSKEFRAEEDHITCSYACAGKWRSQNRKKKLPIIQYCAFCNKQFQDIKQRVTCCNSCSRKWSGLCRTRERIISSCPICGKDVENIANTLYPKTYCSRSCASKVNVATSFFTPDSRAKAKSALTGVPKSDAHKKAAGEAIKIAWIARKARGNYIHIHTDDEKRRISEAKKKHITESVGCRCGACLPHRKEPTKIELILKAHLENVYPGEEVRVYEKFGRFFVDAYIPSLHLAFEADGEHWHPIGDERDITRDAYLLENFDLPVIRIWGGELWRIEKKFHYLQIA